MTAPSAAWPTRDLVGALARSGWGQLADRSCSGLRTVLRALVDVLPYGSGAGHSTAWQLADTTGLSERWVRRCLARLEALGLIAWTRGGVVAGRPTPSLFRIDKRRLAAMVRAARKADETGRRMSARARQLSDRIQAAGRLTFHAHRRPAPHAELSTAPPSIREATRSGVALTVDNLPAERTTQAMTHPQTQAVYGSEAPATSRPRVVDGWLVDWNRCETCSRSRTGHDRAQLIDPDPHSFQPARIKRATR